MSCSTGRRLFTQADNTCAPRDRYSLRSKGRPTFTRPPASMRTWCGVSGPLQPPRSMFISNRPDAHQSYRRARTRRSRALRTPLPIGHRRLSESRGSTVGGCTRRRTWNGRRTRPDPRHRPGHLDHPAVVVAPAPGEPHRVHREARGCAFDANPVQRRTAGRRGRRQFCRSERPSHRGREQSGATERAGRSRRSIPDGARSTPARPLYAEQEPYAIGQE